MAVSTKCFNAATLALQSHLKCFAYFRDRKIHKQAEYVNWSVYSQTKSQVLLTDYCRILLYPSFTPFVIVFTHAITTASPDDLVLLHETVNSLELIKGLSRGSTRLYEICTAFVKTAQALADSRQTLTGLEQHHDGLLLMPGLDGHGQASITLPDVAWPEDMYGSMNSADISGFLNDFIGTNRSAMDILNSIT